MSQSAKRTSSNSDKQMEADKLFFDGLKHLTTMDTALIVILAASLEKLFSNPKQKGLVFICLISVSISLVACLWEMFSIGSKIEGYKMKSAVEACVGIAFSFFFFGIVALVWFTIVNLQ